MLSADQHENFLHGPFSAPVKIDSYWDLRDVRPLFNVPCCVIYATRDDKLKTEEVVGLVSAP